MAACMFFVAFIIISNTNSIDIFNYIWQDKHKHGQFHNKCTNKVGTIFMQILWTSVYIFCSNLKSVIPYDHLKRYL